VNLVKDIQKVGLGVHTDALNPTHYFADHLLAWAGIGPGAKGLEIG